MHAIETGDHDAEDPVPIGCEKSTSYENTGRV